VAAGRLALAHELIGLGMGMLALSVTHVRDRTQFGVPLGTFQAVQHRLADVHVQLEAARAITRTAWLQSDPFVSAAALLAARRAVETGIEHCHQVMGAIGCTWEHNLHRYIRRTVALSLLLDVDLAMLGAMAAQAVSTRRTEVFV
jgi:alkylation response protein AidB-like acyl-CoA dehydrogenase